MDLRSWFLPQLSLSVNHYHAAIIPDCSDFGFNGTIEQKIYKTPDLSHTRDRSLLEAAMTALLPKLTHLSAAFPLEGAICIELVDGIPIFRASKAVQSRIEMLLEKQEEDGLSVEENQELDCYAEMDDYLSFVNRTVRNLYITQR